MLNTVFAISTDSSTDAGYSTGGNEYIKYYTRSNGFDVHAWMGGDEITTVYADAGYKTEIQVNSNSKEQLSPFTYGRTYISNGVKAKIYAETPSTDSKGVVFTYEVENTNLDTVTVKIGSWADVSVSKANSNDGDTAPIELTNNALIMTHPSNTALKFMLVPGGGNFTTRWMGNYSASQSNVFNNAASNTLTGVDSGVAWSWTLTIPSGATITKTAILSAGDVVTYNLSFDSNGGSGTMETLSYVGGVSTSLPANTFTNENWDFMGWSETAHTAGDGTAPTYFDQANITLNSDKTLYAVWGTKEQQKVTVEAENITLTYGDTDGQVQATSTGNGMLTYELVEDNGVIAVNYRTGEITTRKAGTAQVKVTALETPQYKKGEKIVTVTVNLAQSEIVTQPTITAPEANELTYNGHNQVLVNAGTTSCGNDCHLEYALGSIDTAPTTGWSRDVESFKKKNAGTYYVWYKLDGEGKYNDIASTSPVTVTIAKAALNIKPSATTITYGGRVENVALTYEGLQDSDPEIPVTELRYISDYQIYDDVGDNYFVQLSGGSTPASENYNITINHDFQAQLTVVPKELEIRWSDTEFTYDKSPHKPTATAVRLVNNDECLITVSGEQTNAGNYTATASGLFGSKSHNYKLPSAVTQSFTISPKVIGLNWSNTALTYNGSSQKPTAEATNLENGDSCTVTVSGEQTNAGSYTATAASLSNNNYELLDVKTQNFTISPKVIDLSWSNTALTYNGSEQAPEAAPTAGSLIGSDTCTVTVDGKKKDVGSYTAEAASLSNSNYALPNTKTQNFTISPKVITLTWSNTALTYNGSPQKPTAEAANLENGDSCEITVSGEQTNAGTPYYATATQVNNSNYKLSDTITDNQIQFHIDKAAVTFKAVDQTVDLGGTIVQTPSQVSITAGNLMSGHSVAAISLNATSTANAIENGVITPVSVTINDGNGTGVTSNYAISFENGNLRVLKGAPSYTLPQGNDLTYNRRQQSLVTDGIISGGTIFYALGENDTIAPTEGWNETSPSGIDAHTYYVWHKVTGDSNHNDIDPACIPVVIKPWNIAEAEVSLSNTSFDYDEQEKSVTVNDVKLAGESLSSETDYTVEMNGTSGTDAAVYTVKVNGKGNYTGTTQADWSIIKQNYEVSWLNDDNSLIDTTSVIYGEMPVHDDPVKTPTAQYTWTFLKWDPELSPVKAPTEYKAVYTETVNTYTIVWKNYDGEVLKTDENISYGEMPVYEGTPVREGNAEISYTFSGWKPEVTQVTGDAEYTADFSNSTNAYTVVWKNYNGEVLETDENVLYGTMPIYDGETPEKPSTPEETFAFTGWTPAVSNVTGDVTYTAVFSNAAAIYNVIVTAVGNGTASASHKTAAVGTEVTLTAEPEVGFDFREWVVKQGDVIIEDNLFVMGTADVEIEAQFEAKDYAFVSGSGQYYEKDSGEDKQFKAKAVDNDEKDAYTYFTGITVDEALVESSNYTAVSDQKGGVSIILKYEYLEKLAAGEHTLIALFSDGDAEARFNIVEPETPSQPMTRTVEIVNLKHDGSKMIPVEFSNLALTIRITLKGDSIVSRSKETVVLILNAEDNPVISRNVEFTKLIDDLAPGKYEVTIEGIPSTVTDKEIIYDADESPEVMTKWKYKLDTRSEINKKSNDIIIRIYLIWDDGSRPDEIAVYALPEDEIGAYAILQDGTKEYLLFHTYDICMNYLGSDELCRSYERCFHKEGYYAVDWWPIEIDK
ncbi:MAG: InlB B-repeat-containing protein [Anaerolineaceae bacterium]|nr:InlB B-repeat-containing protein [Anaerolineaceae bacterium]